LKARSIAIGAFADTGGLDASCMRDRSMNVMDIDHF
jgi:hypothetical protein